MAPPLRVQTLLAITIDRGACSTDTHDPDLLLSVHPRGQVTHSRKAQIIVITLNLFFCITFHIGETVSSFEENTSNNDTS